MRRRLIIAAAAAGTLAPVLAGAQSGQRPRRLAVFMDVPADDPRAQTRLAAFAQGLQEAGWTIGRNLRVEYRWRAENPENLRATARELVASAPDVILGSSSPVIAALRAATQDIPIVFVAVIDPVGAGFVESFARPGGMVTGFSTIDFELGGKWLEILKELAPGLTEVAVLVDPSLPSMPGQIASLEAAAAKLGVALARIDLRDRARLVQDLAAFAAKPGRGIVATAGPLTGLHRDLIIRLAAEHRLPAIYPYDHFAPAGGLIAFGPDLAAQWRSAAGYVDRILKGAKPADLPVQAPTKIDLIINLRTAGELAITIPASLLQRAEEVIE